MNNQELSGRITEYLTNGGLFNPEYMNHGRVRDLLLDIREYLDGIERILEGTEDR
jgi:hypothetical protein